MHTAETWQSGGDTHRLKRRHHLALRVVVSIIDLDHVDKVHHQHPRARWRLVRRCQNLADDADDDRFVVAVLHRVRPHVPARRPPRRLGALFKVKRLPVQRAPLELLDAFVDLFRTVGWGKGQVTAGD